MACLTGYDVNVVSSLRFLMGVNSTGLLESSLNRFPKTGPGWAPCWRVIRGLQVAREDSSRAAKSRPRSCMELHANMSIHCSRDALKSRHNPNDS